MAAISVTANSVATTATTQAIAKLGATVTAGQVVYRDANGVFQLAQADGTAIESGYGSDQMGIALANGVSGQYIAILTSGILTCGGTVVTGTPYFVHTTAGSFGVFGELGSTNRVTCIGFATTTGIINIVFNATGIVI